MTLLEKLESISRILAAVLIPLAIAWMGEQISISNQQRDAQTKLVELATQILNEKHETTSEDKMLREWAVTVINQYSGVPMSVETQEALVDSKVSLPASTQTNIDVAEIQDDWGVVFGGDKTLEAANYEVTVTAKKANVGNAQIFLRAGSYRSVVVFSNRADAEDALGKLKTIRDSSYIVNMNKWCLNSTQREGYYECISR